MKKIINLLTIILTLTSCNQPRQKIGPDYEKIKPELALDSKQEKKFDEITARYNKLRIEAFSKARSGGKMNREAMMAQMKKLFAQQAEKLEHILSANQFDIYERWLEKNTPGRVGWTKELMAKIKEDLSLTPEKALLVDAVNEAFIEAYIGEHDNYHGNNEAAKLYWTEFNSNRNAAIKKLFTEEEYVKFLEITKHVRFKGEHGKGE